MNNILISADAALKKIPEVKDTINYWMLRADGGKYFTDFAVNLYIGIGWNELTVEDINKMSEEEISAVLKETNTAREINTVIDDDGNIIEEQLKEDVPSKRSISSWKSQLIKFVHEIKTEDIVIVPNEGSSRFNAFRVVSQAYDETAETISLQAENKDYKHSDFKKRIPVEFVKSFSRSEVDSAIYPLLYNHHTLSGANDYKSYLNRVIFSVYKEHDNIHLSFRVTEANAISARSLNKLLSGVINTVDATFEDENVDSKLNIQSPGVIEIVLYNLAALSVLTNIAFGILAATGSKLAIVRRDVKMKLDYDTNSDLKDNHDPKSYNEHDKTLDLTEGQSAVSGLEVSFSELGVTPTNEMISVVTEAVITDGQTNNATEGEFDDVTQD